jgi:hypothetical protein
MKRPNAACCLLKIVLPTVVIGLTCVRPTFGASLAFDSAADPVYNDGWQAGDNGGSGFGAWQLFAEYAFLATSTTNGVGDPGNDGDIDTAGRAWGLATYTPVSDHEASFAFRPFDGALSIGQEFVIDIDMGQPAFASGSMGFDILDVPTGYGFDLVATTTHIFANGVDTGVSYSDQGFHIVFTLTGADTYSLKIYGVGSDGPSGLLSSTSGSLFLPDGAALTGVRLSSLDTGPNSESWNFFNSMAIIPEPTTFVLTAAALITLAALRKRKTQWTRPTG